MLRAFFSRLLIAVACLGCLAGCGDADSETTGRIAMGVFPTQLTDGLYRIEVEASYVNPELGAMAGFPITITATIETPDGQPIAKENSGELRTDSSGIVRYRLTVTQGAVPSIVTIVASSGGLDQEDVVVIPAAAPVASNPVP